MDDLHAELEEIKADASQAKKTVLTLKQQVKALTAVVEKSDDALTADRLATREAATKIEALSKEYTTYRSKYRDAIQKRASGMLLADFRTQSGAYSSVRISQLDSWQVAIQHKNGFAKLDLAVLPDDLKKLLAYDPEVGPRPTIGMLASSSGVNVYVPTAPTVSAVNSPATTDGTPRAASAAPVETPGGTGSKGQADESLRLYGDSSIISVWGKINTGGNTSGGTSIKSPPPVVPQGYKPIGSTFSGSAMDSLHKKKDRH